MINRQITIDYNICQQSNFHRQWLPTFYNQASICLKMKNRYDFVYKSSCLCLCLCKNWCYIIIYSYYYVSNQSASPIDITYKYKLYAFSHSLNESTKFEWKQTRKTIDVFTYAVLRVWFWPLQQPVPVQLLGSSCNYNCSKIESVKALCAKTCW